MLVIDTLCYGSHLRYINIEEKFCFTFASIFLCIAGKSIPAACFVFFTAGFLTVQKGGIPLGRYLRLLRIPLIFVLLGTVTILVNISAVPMDAFAVPFGSCYLTGSREGLLSGIRLILSAMACVSCLYFFSLSTPMTDFLVLLKRMYCPLLLLDLMFLMYRFIFILLDTAAAIRTAQDSRLGNRDYRTSLRSFGQLGAALFLRSMKRSSALFDAMESRCYDGTIPVLAERCPAKRKEVAALILYIMLLTALLFL